MLSWSAQLSYKVEQASFHSPTMAGRSGHGSGCLRDVHGEVMPRIQVGQAILPNLPVFGGGMSLGPLQAGP